MSSLADKISTRRLHNAEVSPILLHRRRIYILPTLYGVYFSVLLIIMLIGSINYNNSLGFALTFLMGSTVMISMLHTHRNLSGLKIRCETARSVFCGDEIAYPVMLHNEQVINKPSVRLEISGEQQTIVNIPASGSINLLLTKKSIQRGRIQPGRIKIMSDYPMGLLRAWSWIRPDCECIVYPTPENKPPPPDFQSQGDGESSQTAKGNDEFSGLRPYQPGDSLKKIAWKQSQRGDELFSKQFSSSGQKSLWLEWDMLQTRSLEQKLSRLCRWVLDCESDGLSYGLKIPGNTIPPGQGHRHQHLCLSALATFGQN